VITVGVRARARGHRYQQYALRRWYPLPDHGYCNPNLYDPQLVSVCWSQCRPDRSGENYLVRVRIVEFRRDCRRIFLGRYVPNTVANLNELRPRSIRSLILLFSLLEIGRVLPIPSRFPVTIIFVVDFRIADPFKIGTYIVVRLFRVFILF